MTKQNRFLPTQLRAASLSPATFNKADRTVEVVWTTGARVRRMDYWTGQAFEEELVVDAGAIDLTRLNTGGAPVLNTHSSYSLDDQIGVVERAWVVNGEGRAVLRLSEREEVAGIVRDIEAGLIKNISVGYNVRKYEIISAVNRTDGGTLPLYRAVDWEPAELSFVPIPADAMSGTRSDSARGSDCEFSITAAAPASAEAHRAAAHLSQESSMPQVTEAGGATATPANPTAAAPATVATTAPAVVIDTRAADISELCTRHGVPTLAAGMIRGGQSIDQARAAVLAELAVRDAAAGGHRNVANIQTVQDSMQVRMAGIEQAILHRVAPGTKLDDNGRQYRGMSLIEIGRDFLEAHGMNTRGQDRMQLAGNILHFRASGMHGTSDFSTLFANVANKRLRNAYDENPGTYALWARRAPNAPDFKNLSVAQLSGAPDLLQTNEHGEFKYGKMTDGGEVYAVLTYGRIVSLTRQAIINDDLRAFERLVSAFGFAARRLENRTVYAQLTANAALADTVALFHATHSNLGIGAPSALQMTALTTARAAMRLQKGLANEELSLAPSYLIVPAALEQLAYQLTSSQYIPAKQSDVNEFRTGGRTALEAVVEPILDANSATAWYLAAANSQVDTVEYCYLDGAEGPMIESDIGFEVDGVSYKCRLDFAAKAIDYRGLYKAAGA
jgi:hypothetical protein